MPSVVVKQICIWQIPSDVTHPLAELPPGIAVRLTIEFDGHGYCLVATELDGDHTLAEWHPSLKTAEQKAVQLFGPSSKDWETVGMQ
ncbi:MAG: hypothetical protein AAF282_05315 [Cyanobacteria bacterium P01_A01_bin.15]